MILIKGYRVLCFQTTSHFSLTYCGWQYKKRLLKMLPFGFRSLTSHCLVLIKARKFVVDHFCSSCIPRESQTPCRQDVRFINGFSYWYKSLYKAFSFWTFFQFRPKYFGGNLSQTGKSHFYSVIRKTAQSCCGRETA